MLPSSLLLGGVFSTAIIGVCSASAWPPRTPPSAAARVLQSRLDATIAAGAATFVIPPGDYDFGSAAFNISGARGLHIRAEGSPRLLFSLGGVVVVQSSTNSVLQGPLTIDYTEEPASQAIVRSVGSGCFSTSTPPHVCELDVDVATGFPPPDPLIRPDLCFYPSCETKLVFFEGALPRNLRHPQQVTWLLNSTRLPSAPDAAVAQYRIATQQLWAHNLAVGDHVAIASRRCGGCTYQLIHSSNFTTQDLVIHGSCNMAVWELGGLGGNTFSRLRVQRPPGSQRLLAANFDGFHSEGSKIAPTLRDSVIEFIADDFFNVHNAIDVVLGYTSRGEPVVADNSFNSTFATAPMVKGATVGFFRPTDNLWISTPIGSAVIKRAVPLPTAERPLFLARAANISATFAARFGWSLAGFLSQHNALFKLELESWSGRAPEYADFAQVNSSYGAVIEGNRFAQTIGRAGVLNSIGARVSNNTFISATGGGLLVDAETSWLSGNLGVQRDMTVEDNTFEQLCVSPVPFLQCNCTAPHKPPLCDPVYNPAQGTGVTNRGNRILVKTDDAGATRS
jgi:hypothetical protein